MSPTQGQIQWPTYASCTCHGWPHWELNSSTLCSLVIIVKPLQINRKACCKLVRLSCLWCSQGLTGLQCDGSKNKRLHYRWGITQVECMMTERACQESTPWQCPVSRLKSMQCSLAWFRSDCTCHVYVDSEQTHLTVVIALIWQSSRKQSCTNAAVLARTKIPCTTFTWLVANLPNGLA